MRNYFAVHSCGGLYERVNLRKDTCRYIRAAQGLLGLFARRTGSGCGRERVCRAAAVMGFGDLKSAAGLRVLNDFLADRSYIEG